MINKALQIAFIGFIWKRYKTLILLTLALFAYFWLVGKLHQDFLAYSNAEGLKQNIGWSFIAKWGAYFFGLVVYFFVYTKLHHRRDNNEKNTDKENNLLFMKRDNSKETEQREKNDTAPQQSDPFAEIRKKDKLRSPADFLLEQDEKKE